MLRDGGPTKRVGAGRRLGLVFEAGEGLFGLEVCEADDMIVVCDLTVTGTLMLKLSRYFGYCTCARAQMGHERIAIASCPIERANSASSK